MTRYIAELLRGCMVKISKNSSLCLTSRSMWVYISTQEPVTGAVTFVPVRRYHNSRTFCFYVAISTNPEVALELGGGGGFCG